MRLRVDLGRTGGPGLLAARSQHEQRGEHHNGDEWNGRDEQHGGRDREDRGQREKNCSEGQDYSESKNDISFLHAVFEEAITRPASSVVEALGRGFAIEVLFAQNGVPCQSIRAKRDGDVQETMNKVVKAENEKVAAVDFATATETIADGARRAEIKRAEGVKQAKILEAEGEALAIQLVNEAADRYFTGNAQLLRRLITVERSLQNNSKVVVPAGSELVNVIGDIAGVLPLPGAHPEPRRASRGGQVVQ